MRENLLRFRMDNPLPRLNLSLFPKEKATGLGAVYDLTLDDLTLSALK